MRWNEATKVLCAEEVGGLRVEEIARLPKKALMHLMTGYDRYPFMVGDFVNELWTSSHRTWRKKKK